MTLSAESLKILGCTITPDELEKAIAARKALADVLVDLESDILKPVEERFKEAEHLFVQAEPEVPQLTLEERFRAYDEAQLLKAQVKATKRKIR